MDNIWYSEITDSTYMVLADAVREDNYNHRDLSDTSRRRYEVTVFGQTFRLEGRVQRLTHVEKRSENLSWHVALESDRSFWFRIMATRMLLNGRKGGVRVDFAVHADGNQIEKFRELSSVPVQTPAVGADT